jgi:hypothetical protein
MKIRFLLLLLITLGVNAVGHSQVIETSKGKVEFIGLELWSPQKIQEKLGYSSTDGLHFCAAELKKTLGFPDAAVNVSLEEGRLYTVITVVEPQYTERVQYRPEPSTSLATPDEWRDLLPLAEQRKFINNLLDYGQSLKGAVKVQKPYLRDSDLDKSWWPLLQQRRSERDYQQALRSLIGDRDYRNRMIAAVILTNFADRNAAWLALMDGVRDQNPFVNGTCSQALQTLTTYFPRKVDWAKAAPSIHHILNGTNLFACKLVMKTLTKTKVAAKLAPSLLRNSGAKLLFAYLKANHKEEREVAHQLLTQLSRKDFGYDDEKWRAWVASLV